MTGHEVQPGFEPRAFIDYASKVAGAPELATPNVSSLAMIVFGHNHRREADQLKAVIRKEFAASLVATSKALDS
ncbi:UNVERIFIED_CONTAM: hypothetical protein Sangu_2943400 [Sesamum angustifolium]|uniref:Uncharacterized protein n=1 Tax=Sesamum angustifolium TaxID=2727405 RepID=A0AAW2ILA0_9LAMI